MTRQYRFRVLVTRRERIVSVLKDGIVVQLCPLQLYSIYNSLTVANSDTFRVVNNTMDGRIRWNAVGRPGRWDWSHEGKREDQELDNGTCCRHIKSDPRAQTFMKHARPSPIWTVEWVNCSRTQNEKSKLTKTETGSATLLHVLRSPWQFVFQLLHRPSSHRRRTVEKFSFAPSIHNKQKIT